MSKSADYAAECLQKELASMSTTDLVNELANRPGVDVYIADVVEDRPATVLVVYD